MFDQLQSRLNSAFKKITGQGRLTEKNIESTLKEVRKAFLEADVALPVVKNFLKNLKQRVIGSEVHKSLNPGQAFIKIVHEELITTLGGGDAELNLKAKPPIVIMVAGLQGSGKTTTVAKLAQWLQHKHKKKILITSCDIYRPAAIDQLKTLAETIGIDFLAPEGKADPKTIVNAALSHAKKQFSEILLVDTAGRLHIDDTMMAEIKNIHELSQPTETLFVVDSMMGQDAVKAAKAFHDAISLTGIILTKVDGDARGGAALSVREVTGQAIKFMGTGEKTDALEVFHPDRIASRILGMGDMLSLIENIESKVDKAKAEKLAKKIKKGKGFDLEDLREQLEQMNKMGGLTELMTKLPGMGNIPDAMKSKMQDNKQFIHIKAIIDSMTPKERHNPKVINGSRKRRIAMGSGTSIQHVNKVLKQHIMMAKMMKKVGKGGMKNMMRSIQGMMPPGGGFSGGGGDISGL